MPNAGVLGLFPHVEIQQEQVQIDADNTLLTGAEFGEAGLISYLQRNTGASPATLVSELAEALEQMSEQNSSDDITLVAARGVSR